jgi:hypothetical protein
MRAVESPLFVELPAAFDEHPGPGATAEPFAVWQSVAQPAV